MLFISYSKNNRGNVFITPIILPIKPQKSSTFFQETRKKYNFFISYNDKISSANWQKGHFMNIKLDNFPKTWRGFYWLVIKHFPWYMGTMFLFVVLENITALAINPYLYKWQINVLENAIHTDWSKFYFFIGLICLYYIWDLVIKFVPSFLRGIYSRKMHRYLNFLLYYRVYNNDISFFIDMPGATIMSYTNQINQSLESLTTNFIGEIIGTSIGLVTVCIAMTVLNWRFLIVIVGYGIIKMIWQWLNQKKITKQVVVIQDEFAKYSGKRSDSLSHTLIAKLFANTEYENQVIFNSAGKLITKERRHAFLTRNKYMPTNILWSILSIVMLIMCFWFVKNGSLTIADSIFVLTAIARINNAIGRWNQTLTKYTETRAKVKTAYETVIKKRSIIDKPRARILREKNPDIIFDNVSFGYGDKKILKNLSLTIAPKEKVGIVGLSGAGKTTLCNLLMRMYEVGAGSIRIAGFDLRDIKHESLLKNISYVPQETELFNRSVMDNIKYAKPHASDIAAIKASKAAHIHEKISKLPNGYDTLVGNNGYKFSGGERQRLSIARALLKNAPIIILDEATSAMDSQNELAIQKSLQTALHGKTALVIAHRLSTLRNMDKIIVLKNGQIVETGSHKQLSRKKNGIYKKLWDAQSGGFIA